MENETIESLGEFGLIDRIKKGAVKYNDSTKFGIGDDAAVIDNGDSFTLVSTDMLLEGVHFDLTYTPLKHLGYKAVAINVSDIAAMNGTPKQITVSIAISNRFNLEAVDEFAVSQAAHPAGGVDPHDPEPAVFPLLGLAVPERKGPGADQRQAHAA